MLVPYHLTCTKSHPLLYPLSDGRFQIVEKEGSLAPLMVGADYVIVENSFAEYLKALEIRHLRIVDAVIYDPKEQAENLSYKQLLIDLHFTPDSMSEADLNRDLFLLMDGRHLFVSQSLKDRLETSSFKYLEFSYGLRRFAGDHYAKRLNGVDELRRWSVDPSIIAKAEAEAAHRSLAPNVARRIREAFLGVTLDDGVGLWQAQEIDNYEDDETIARARESDEKEDWTRITSDELNACESSLSFVDAKGMRFLLPAYLIADLEGKYLHGMAFRLTYLNENSVDKFTLLSQPQRSAIRAFLKYIALDDDYEFDRPEILQALNEYWIE